MLASIYLRLPSVRSTGLVGSALILEEKLSYCELKRVSCFGRRQTYRGSDGTKNTFYAIYSTTDRFLPRPP